MAGLAYATASCHAAFLAFEREITPTRAELERSLALRRAVRSVVREAFAGAGIAVRFHAQGSFRLLTAVRRDSLDIDDGLLIATPQGTRADVDALHDFVFHALRRAGYVAFAREPCVRVLHARGIRLDIVLYVRDDQGNSYLAHRADGWIAAHSSLLIGWFESPSRAAASALQARRLVKYYKMWAARQAPLKMPSGLVLTILLKQLHCADARDDVALVASLERVLSHLQAGNGCLRPTPPLGEELLHGELSAAQNRAFVAALQRLIRTGAQALAAESERDAIALWRTELGPTFGTAKTPMGAMDRSDQLVRVLEDHEHAHGETAVMRAAADVGERWTL